MLLLYVYLFASLTIPLFSSSPSPTSSSPSPSTASPAFFLQWVTSDSVLFFASVERRPIFCPFDHFVFIFDVFIAGVRWSRAANAAVEISSLIIAARHLAVARGNGLRYMRAVCLVKRLTAVRY